MKKEFRILLTEKCNANCANCFNANYRTPNDMNLNKLSSLCEMLKNNGIKVLKIMGGEPTVHSEFKKAIEIIQKNFEKTYLFTNGISTNLLNYTPRKNDVIVYNLNLIGLNDNPDKFLLDKEGFRSFEIQISSNANVDLIIEKLKYLSKIFKNKKKLIMNLTLDCMENIFKNRNIIIENWKRVSKFIKEELNTNFNVDHIIPQCFMQNLDIFDFKPRKCSYTCGGLIDTEFNLRFCNQYPVVIKNIFSYKNLEQIEEDLQKAHNTKLELSKMHKCEKCPNFQKTCNGGCFTHKNIFK